MIKNSVAASNLSRFHKTKLNKNIKYINIPLKNMNSCFSQPAKSLCQSLNSNDEKPFENDYISSIKNYNSKTSETGSVAKMHKVKLLSSHNGSNNSMESSPFNFKKLERFGTEGSNIKKPFIQSLRVNSIPLKQEFASTQNGVSPVSLIQAYFPAGIGRNYES